MTALLAGLLVTGGCALVAAGALAWRRRARRRVQMRAWDPAGRVWKPALPRERRPPVATLPESGSVGDLRPSKPGLRLAKGAGMETRPTEAGRGCPWLS